MAAPKVDFYVLPGSDDGARLRFACRLAEKAWLRRHRVRVQLEPGSELETLDQLMWTFSDRSFLPHRRAGAGDDAPAPGRPAVVIAQDATPDSGDGDVIVNLASDVPPAFERFGRVAEIVDADPARRQRGRDRFRFYRERGLDPVMHDMGSEA